VGVERDHLRLVTAYDGSVGGVRARGIYVDAWKWSPPPGGLCFPNAMSEQDFPPRLGECLAMAAPRLGAWPIQAWGFRCTTGEVGAGSFVPISLGHHVVVDLPYWQMVAVSGAILLWQMWRQIPRVRHFLRRSGMCPTCGYDMRASPARCPECGGAIPGEEVVPRQRIARVFLAMHFELRGHPVAYGCATFVGIWAVMMFILGWR